MPNFDFDSERDQRWIDLHDGEALDLMQGWTGGERDPLYAISSSGGNYAWVFEDAIANLDSDIRRVKKLGRNKFQLGHGTYTAKEIDELHIIRDALAEALAEGRRSPKLVRSPSGGRRLAAPRRPAAHGRIAITTLIDMARRSAEGMTDYQNVDPSEDAATAAREIVAYWENEEGLLNRRDQERFEEQGGTAADLDEVRGRVIEIIENAILSDPRRRGRIPTARRRR